MTNDTPKNKVYAGGRVVGEVSGGVFKKTVSGSRHFLIRPRAIALDVDSIRQAKEYGAVGIEITDRETGTVYSCDMGNFARYSFDLNRGFGAQKALTLDRWVTTLDIESKAAKRGEVKQRAGTGPRVRNERKVGGESPRQLAFRGLL